LIPRIDDESEIDSSADSAESAEFAEFAESAGSTESSTHDCEFLQPLSRLNLMIE
jgi:hypothetical protein